MLPNRLPAPWGSRIDRNASFEFVFEGRTYTAHDGDTIASALAANGQKVLSRSFKYHRPRGILTMAGHDANTLVQAGSEPNVRADLRRVEKNMVVKAQNVWGGLSFDLARIMDRLGGFMPVGFYYRSFFQPGSASWLKLWEPIIRSFSGLGKIDFDAPSPDYRKSTLYCDVMVVGAGPAGLAAALEAARAGIEVLLVDQNPEIGGSLCYARFDVDGGAAARTLADLRKAVLQQPNIRVLTGATCNGWFADNWLPVIQGATLYKVRATELVLATGSQEQPLVFRNNDLPGIMLSSAAQRLLRYYGVRPGEKSVVFAGTLDGYRAALDLADAGIAIEAVIDPASGTSHEDYRLALSARGIRIITGARILEARGKAAIRSVVIQTPANGTETISCDLLVIAAGYTPTYQLPLQAGARLDYDDATGQFQLENIAGHMHLAGSLASIFSLDSVLRSGAAAGIKAARMLGREIDEPAPVVEAGTDWVNFESDVHPHPKGRDFIDFDEDLQSKDIWNAVADGYRELELVKRFSTVGMGTSQGRHSALATARIVASATNRSVGAVGITTSRPPFGPERLGLLAGPTQNRFRHTAFHEDLVAAGAKMMPVGAWWRPAYVGEPSQSGAVITREINAVRNAAGMLDVSTLGKMAVRGPDAGRFLDRFYTMLHSTQAVGKVRYCLMLNEMGTVVDDGVAYRIAGDYYHVSTTTGMADRVYAEMSLWNAQWQMAVDIQNVTAAFAGVNLTGPLARKVIEGLETDIDFSREAFGFLDGRSGMVAGCEAHVMRIGYSGELSYEFHVPYSQARRLWAALLKAGAPYGIMPYGLEASRILRLEKGHIIIGQDTDALTTPDELSMEWALSKKKPFYIGKTALERRRQSPMTRKLCAFTLDAGSDARIEEGCLVFRKGEPVGFVSSFGLSPTLGKKIGLAYAHPEDALPGGTIGIQTLGGRTLEAPVVSPHLYDPENDRQKI